jgi:hypothetical protein
MQHHSSFNASYDMGLNLENRFCRLAVHCAPYPSKIEKPAKKTPKKHENY